MEKQKYIEVFNMKNALTDHELKSFCSKHNLPYHYCELKDLKNSLDSLPNNCFVFTGNEKNDANNGYTEHWLYLFGNQLFDSYSFQKHYNISDSIEPVKIYPRQLQEFNAVVCGEYCLAFASYIEENEFEEDEVGNDFCNYYGFSKNKFKNDEKVYNWYEENK
jgi:hypothetical protein